MAKKPSKKTGTKVSPKGVKAPDFYAHIIKTIVAGVFSDTGSERWQIHLRRWWIGGLGGIGFAILRNLFNERVGLWELFTMEPGARRGEIYFGYFIGGIASALSGGLGAWLSGQKNYRLLFVCGMVGCSVLTTLLPGLQSSAGKTAKLAIDNPFSLARAYAETEPSCVGDTAFAKGFKAFFGVRERYDKYAVVVASGKSPADAQSKLKTVIAEDPNLKLRVGPRACDNDYFPVIASDYLPLDDAKMALDKIKKLKSAPDAYLSPGPRQ